MLILIGFVTWLLIWGYAIYDAHNSAKKMNNGIMIDIKHNDPNGIVVYNNFYITEKLKKQAAEGKIKIELSKNSIEEEEKARINN